MTNPARDALSRAVNRAIAEGAPIVTEQPAHPPRTYRLGSSPIVHTPGIVVWARSGWAFPADRPYLLRVITEGWRIPEHAAEALLSGRAPYEIDGETVVFTA